MANDGFAAAWARLEAARSELATAEASYAEASNQFASDEVADAREVSRYGYGLIVARPAQEKTVVERTTGDFQAVHPELGSIRSTTAKGLLEKAQAKAAKASRRGPALASGPKVVRGLAATDGAGEQ